MGGFLTIDYQVFDPKPLQAGDYVEFDLVSELNQRMALLQSLSIRHESKNKNGFPFFLKILRKTSTWILFRFPQGSVGRKVLKNLNQKMPIFIQNQVARLLASQSTVHSLGVNNFAYHMDLGFGVPTSSNPLLTIVIPVHNNWWVTYACLRKLQTNSDKTPYEIVIVDDASTDQTKEALDNLRGITVVRNLKNIGYLLSTNRGASVASASSKYLVLLNNDTQPLSGWLDNLYATIEEDESIAIAGSLLIFPDGQVQEAGGQIFANANAWNLGRGGNPTSQVFNFTREVDYSSAAAIMVRKTFWLDVNGFDERYAPAYCEDSDLALTAWKKNMKVVFSPKSCVIHYEGVSHGRSVSTGLKKNQVINSRKLFTKWELELREHWEDSGIPRFEATRASKGIVVVCDRQLPSVTRDAGSIRTVQIVKHIQALGYHVVLTAIDAGTTELDLDLLRSSGVEVHTSLDDFYDSLVMRRLRIKTIWTIRQEVYEFFSTRLRSIAPSSNFIADLVDIRFQEEYSENSGIAAGQLQIASKVQKVVFCSQSEAQVFNKKTKLKNAVSLWSEFEPQQSILDWNEAIGLIFVGGFRHIPNLEGIQWFADYVVPELKKMGFSAPIRVVGSGLTTAQKVDLESKNLQVLGWQLDLPGIYLQSRVAVIPLQHGAGRKGKVGEALSFGIPIVSTSVGVQGFIDLQNTGIVVTDSSVEMAQSIYDLHNRFELWSRASNLGKSYCESNLSSAAMRNVVSTLISPESGNDSD
jgi:GT2 family glycosyltransferase